MITILLQATPTLPKDFFTPDSIKTFAGATGITYVIANGLQQAFNVNPKWLALLIGILVCELGAYLSKSTEVGDYLMGIVNGFLVFNAAGGVTNLSNKAKPTDDVANVREGTAPPVAPKRTFNTPWFD